MSLKPKDQRSRLAVVLLGAALAAAGCDRGGTGDAQPDASGERTPAAQAPAGGPALFQASKARPGVQTFTNSPRTAVAPKLRENYVDFSFNYPASWSLDPETGAPDASNFVKVVGPKTAAGSEAENFAVGYLAGSGSPELDQALIPQVLAQLEAQSAAGFPAFRVVSRGETTIGGAKGREFRFESRPPASDGGPAAIWGRMIAVPPPPGSRAGLTVNMLATSEAQGLTSAADLGVKGELPVIVDSFRLKSAR